MVRCCAWARVTPCVRVWRRICVFFVTRQQGALNKAHMQYLDARQVELALAAKRMPLDTQNTPDRPTLNEADQADMEVFLSNLLQILPLLGISAFEKPSTARPSRNKRLFMEAKGLKAEGYESTEGFVVCEGSEAALDIVRSLQAYASSRVEDRKKLIASGVMVLSGDRYQFTQDYSFSSPSTAATIVMGRNVNGRAEWKDSAGVTLKAIQEALADQG